MNTPQPILPGVPVPFPCWLYYSGWGRWYHSSTFVQGAPDLKEATHYLVAPATADPATFPKAEQPVPESHAMGLVTSAEQLHLAISVFLKDWRDGDFQLSELAAIHALAIKKKYLEVGRALKAGNDAFLEFQAMLSAPSAGTETPSLANEIACHFVGNSDISLEEGRAWVASKLVALTAIGAGTEQKEQGAWDCLVCKGTGKFRGNTGIEPCLCVAAAPTDGTTTPRTDKEADWPERYRGDVACVPADFARQLERELNAAKALISCETLGNASQLVKDVTADLTARLALTEKRLGEAQGEVAELYKLAVQPVRTDGAFGFPKYRCRSCGEEYRSGFGEMGIPWKEEAHKPDCRLKEIQNEHGL